MREGTRRIGETAALLVREKLGNYRTHEVSQLLDEEYNCKLPLAGCNPQSEIYNLDSLAGVLAQLVERLNGIEEVRGSNPLGSTPF